MSKQKKEFYIDEHPDARRIDIMLGSGHEYVLLRAASKEAAIAFMNAIPATGMIYDAQHKLLVEDIRRMEWLDDAIAREYADNVRAEIAQAIVSLIQFRVY